MTMLARIEALYDGGGACALGEGVGQVAHGLQSAMLAEADGAAPALVVAALLHDIGHMLHDPPDDCAGRGVDDRHEITGAKWLARNFPAAVTEPIRLHVAAKRYLCATEPDYAARLSPASVRSLDLQGAAFAPEAAAAFIALPYADDAVRLRRWDEAAKVVGAETPGYAHYRSLIEAVAQI